MSDAGAGPARARRPHPPAALLAVAAAAATWLALCAPASAATETPPAWSAPVSIDPGNTLVAVSCVNTTFCAAVDAVGDVLSSTDPEHNAWKSVAVDSNGALTAISCPTASLCVAADEDGDLLVSTDPTGGASTWQVEAVDSEEDGADPIIGVSCASASLCAAAGAEGDMWVSTKPAGGTATWSDAELDQESFLDGVSCVPSLCVAVDDNGEVLTAGQPAAGAGAWSAPVDIDGADELAGGVSCATATLCATLDASGNALVSSSPAQGAGAWTSTAIEPGASFAPGGLSCVSGPLCVAVDGTGNALASIDPAAAHPTWALKAIDTNPLDAVSCTPAGMCVAVDENGSETVGVGRFGTATGAGGTSGGGGRPGSRTAARPVLSRLRLAPDRLRARSRGSSLARAGAATLSYRDSEASRTTFAVLALRPGRVRHGRCVPVALARATRRATGRRCTAAHRLGRFAHRDRAGRERLGFTGRVAGHALAPGRYELQAWARLHRRLSRTVTTRFTVLAPGR